MVASNCNIETQIEMRDWTVGLFPEPLDVSHLDVGDELCLGGEYLVALQAVVRPGGNCIKIGLHGKSILGDYIQENRTSPRPIR